MEDILFSSWGGHIVDNRGKEPGTYAPVSEPRVPEHFKKDEKIRALMGWNGIIVRSPDVDILDLYRAYVEANLDHAKTCDKCNYCKTGWEEQLEVLEDISKGEASEEDLEFLQSSAEAIRDAGKCTIGKAGPLPLLQALEYFADDFSKAVKGETSLQPGTHRSKLTAPCMDACPIHLDVPKYVELIKDAKFADALDVIRERLPFAGVVGRVCVRPCEDHCRRSHVDDAISIMWLKRFVADQEISEDREPQFQITPSEKKGKVAIVGAGPAGITCGFHLALRGHQVTIFEKLPVAGGMMAVGIPRYSLPQDILGREIQTIEKLGVTIQTGRSFGDDLTLETLKADGFDAVFLAPGLHGGRTLGVEGEGLNGIYGGIQFLRDVALGKEVSLGERVIVVGGGNVAVDVARSAIRLGAARVTMVCLEERQEMPAWEREIEGAMEEGVQMIHAYGPRRIIGSNGKVSGVEFKRCTRVFDQDGRFNPQYDESDLMTLEADTLILAIGQCAGPDFPEKETRGTSFSGQFRADPVTLQTELKWVFAGGDALYGPDSVVKAAASGKKAAERIDRFINNLPVEPDEDDHFDALFKFIRPYDPHEEIKKVEPAERRRLAKLAPEARIKSFQEVEQGFSTADAVAEAERCLRCYRVVTLAV